MGKVTNATSRRLHLDAREAALVLAERADNAWYRMLWNVMVLTDTTSENFSSRPTTPANKG